MSNFKAAIYTRVSTHHQIDKDSLSIQKNELINYCKYAIDIEEYEIFEDAGYSGKNTLRPAYQQMLSRVRDNEFTHIVVWKIDRISRNLLDFASLYQELKELNVIFISKNEQFDTSTAIGEAMLKIILVFAELERQMTSERVTATMLARAGEGKWNGGRVPFGYNFNKETKEFTINKSEAEIVHFMYNFYEKSKSLLQVVRKLNEKNILTRGNRKWSATTISIILNNPFYIGTLRYNHLKESNRSTPKSEKDWIMIEDHHIPIIEKEQFYNCQVILKEKFRKRKGFTTRATKNLNLFAGLLKCAYCDKQMVCQPVSTNKNKDSWTYSYYSCSSRRKTSCKNKFVSDMTLGPFAINYIANIIKARNSFGKNTSIETLEKKLLRGKIFEDIEHIERSGLLEFHKILSASKNKIPFVLETSSDDGTLLENNEYELLHTEKHTNEKALDKLKSLYLYTDNLSEKEFFIEKAKVSKKLEKINKRLEELEKENKINLSTSDEELIQKASLFILEQKLNDKREINFNQLMNNIDGHIVKYLFNYIIQNLCVKDGKVVSICFKNGTKHEFLYKKL